MVSGQQGCRAARVIEWEAADRGRATLGTISGMDVVRRATSSIYPKLRYSGDARRLRVVHAVIETYTSEKLPWLTTPGVRSFEKFPAFKAYEDLAKEYAAQLDSQLPVSR